MQLLQFQLTINFVALAVAAVAAVTNGEPPLNVLQLLWVNLIMDAMAALGKNKPGLPKSDVNANNPKLAVKQNLE